MTSFSDDFNRADSTNLGAGWVEVSGDWSIISQQLSSGSAGGTIILRAATAMASSDHYAQVTISGTTAASHGIWIRGNSSGGLTSGYLWRNDGASWNLFYVVGGSFTSIGSYAVAAVAGDVAKVQAVGSTITAYVNGTQRVSITDTNVPTGTGIGIRAESVSALRFDNFTAADVVAGATLTTVTETGTAQALTGTKTATLARAAEQATAQSLTGAKTATLVFVTEQGTAQALTGSKTATLATAVETGTARPLTGVKVATLATVTETDTAQALSGAKTATLTPATETDAAQPLTGVKTATLSTAGTTESALPLTGTKTATLPLAGEVDTAQAFSGTPAMVLPVAGSVETAMPLTGVKTAVLPVVVEVGTARRLAPPSTVTSSPERTYTIPADPRRLTVEAENRRLTVVAEVRTLTVR